MDRRARIGAALALVTCVAGCETLEPSGPPAAVVLQDDRKAIAPNAAQNAVVIGRSTRADVRAALGETLVVSFDTGYEVWVYRVGARPRARTDTSAEFVILFGPSGVVAKTRIRPAPPG